MLKTYDLMARHFAWDKAPKAASESETSEYLLDRALRSQGIVSLDSICHLDARAADPKALALRDCARSTRACRSRSAGV